MQVILWLTIGVILAISSPLLKRIKVPQAAMIIIIGLMIGPFYLNLVDVGEVEGRIVEIVIVLMLFSAGFEIRWSHFIQAIKPGIIVGFCGILLSMLLGFAASYFVSGNIEQSLYLGTALTATSIGLTIPLLAKENLLTSRLGQIFLAAAIVDDIVALYLLSAVHLGLESGNDSSQVLISILVSLIVMLLLGGLVFMLTKKVAHFSFFQNSAYRLLYFIIVALLSAWITHLVDLSSAVGGFIAGAAIALTRASDKERDSVFLNKLTQKLTPLFFLSIGMRITTLEVSDPR